MDERWKEDSSDLNLKKRTPEISPGAKEPLFKKVL
jgi:hypothetical protein